jgi:hypothetical protein
MKYCLRRPSTEDLTAEKLTASCLLEEIKARTVLIAYMAINTSTTFAIT